MARTQTLTAATLVVLLLAGCGPSPTAAPTPTRAALSIAPLPTATPTPRPTHTQSPQPPPPTPSAGGAPTVQRPADAAPVPRPDQSRCEVPTTPGRWTLTPVQDAPPDAVVPPTLSARVVEHRAEVVQLILEPIEPALGYRLALDYAPDRPPLELDRTYRLTTHADAEDAPPAGVGLKAEDEAGLVFLGVSVRETENAAARLLDGDRAGFAIRQRPTTCLTAAQGPCGYTHYAAPVDIRAPEAEAPTVLHAGDETTLDGYRARVYTSHHRLWAGGAPCSDPTDWVLSYAIWRGDASTDSDGGS